MTITFDQPADHPPPTMLQYCLIKRKGQTDTQAFLVVFTPHPCRFGGRHAELSLVLTVTGLDLVPCWAFTRGVIVSF